MNSVCVFLGSNPGGDPAFLETARATGRELARRGLCVVYGGSNVGLMGALADAALAEGGRVVGVIPEHLRQKEVAHLGLTELHVVESMHKRKAMMAELSDGFMALPGGMGTLEELCEILTWAQLGFHTKPCGLVNVNGYYDQLLAFLDNSTRAGFIRTEHRGMLLAASNPAGLLAAFAEYRAPTVSKWIKAPQGL